MSPGGVVTQDDKAACREARREYDQKIAAERREALRRLSLRLSLPEYVVRQYFDDPQAT
jgi:hypothetical protein